MASEPQEFQLPLELGVLEVHPARSDGPDSGFFGSPAAHCRVSDGRTVVWRPGPGHGHPHFMDAELVTQDVGGHVAECLEADEGSAILRWTRLEVAAKASGIPVLLLLVGSEPAPEIEVQSCIVGDLVVSFAGSVITASEPSREGTNALA